MNLKHFILAAALSVPALGWAVPADPRPRTVTNPDGSELTVRVHGDERFHFMTDADCTTILHRNENGFVEKMTRDGKPLAFTKENAMMLYHEKQAVSPAFPVQEAVVPNGMARMATLNTEGRSDYPTIGNGNRSLVILVEFEDVDFTVENPKEYFTRQLNEPGFSDYGGSGSALDYYKEVSHGLYTPQFDVYGPVKVSKSAAYFKDYNSARMGLLINEAVTSLCESGELKLSDYDFDENGILDTVFIYYAGYGSADSETETIWPHQSDYQYYAYYGYKPIVYDGVKVGPYACANELKGYNPQTNSQPWKDGSTPWVDGIGTFVHEYGHVLGLPDLYDVAYSGDVVTPEDWDVMASGCYNGNGCVPPLYSAYEQWVCRWLEYTDAEDGTHYDLEALGSSDNPTALRIRIPMNAAATNFQSEYFIVEARDNSGWDVCFPTSGLMVWRINYKKNLWINNTVNSASGSNVEIVYAKSSKFPLFNDGAIYEGSGVQLTPSRDYTYWKSPVITDIKYDNELKTGSFDYNMVKPSEAFTVLHDNPVADAGGTRSFSLKWDPVDGVDSYLVTVRTVKSQKIIDDCDAKNVGNNTSLTVSGLSSMYWKLDLEAYVQCVVNGMVSTRVSNVIQFKPSELELGDIGGAVDGIEEDSDAAIIGGVGSIQAPEGASIFSMAGVKVGADNLPAGIYLVSYCGKTSKVIVR